MSHKWTDDDYAALAELIARRAITDCLARFARGIDRIDVDLIRGTYWPDATDVHGGIERSVDDFLSWWLPFQPTNDVGHHFLGSPAVTLDLDSGFAEVETYLVSAARLLGEEHLELVGGRYLDRFARRHDEWRVLRRFVVLDWQCRTDASGLEARLAAGPSGVRGPGDPSYVRPDARDAGGRGTS